MKRNRTIIICLLLLLLLVTTTYADVLINNESDINSFDENNSTIAQTSFILVICIVFLGIAGFLIKKKCFSRE